MINNSLLHYQENYRHQDPMDGFFAKMVDLLFGEACQKGNHAVGETEYEPQSSHVEADGGYKCIHFPISRFLEQAQFVIQHFVKPSSLATTKFLDIGCGVGQKVFLAHVLGFQSFGLELREPLIKEAKEVFRKLNTPLYLNENMPNGRQTTKDRFIQGDALKADYSAYDVLYFYCPLFNRTLERKLEERIIETAKSGALVIANLSAYFGYGNGSGGAHPSSWRHVGDRQPIFQKA